LRALVIALGFFISCVIGHYVVKHFLGHLRQCMGLRSRTDTLAMWIAAPLTTRTPAALTGFVERVFFTILVASNVSDILTGMIGWLALKLGANWQSRKDEIDEEVRTNYAFSALLAGLVSMLMAYLGGWFIKRYG
jgi:hypothetical protein